MSDEGFLSVSYLGTEQLNVQAQAQSLKDTAAIDYQRLTSEHSHILKKIKSLEEERQVEPTDSIKLSCQLQRIPEESTEYVEDPRNMIAQNLESGRVLRAKLKVTLSYSPGSNPVSPLFRQVQLNIDCSKETVWCENPVHQFDDLSFEHSQTPTVI